jgi:hypothetical protein
MSYLSKLENTGLEEKLKRRRWTTWHWIDTGLSSFFSTDIYETSSNLSTLGRKFCRRSDPERIPVRRKMFPIFPTSSLPSFIMHRLKLYYTFLQTNVTDSLTGILIASFVRSSCWLDVWERKRGWLKLKLKL